MSEALVECNPRNEFHDQKVTVPLGAELVNGGNIRVVQFGERECFAAESFAVGFVLKFVRWKDLDGDIAFQAIVVSAVHNAHSTRAALFEDGEIPQRLANHCSTLMWFYTDLAGSLGVLAAKVNGACD
jgi:hypothetical protein